MKFSDRAEFVDVPALPALPEFSIALWFRTSDAHGPLISILPRVREAGPCDAEFRLYLADGRLRSDFCGVAMACDAVADDRWHHVVYRYQPVGAGTHGIYLDGRACGSVAGLPGNRLGDKLRIGGYEFVLGRPTHEALSAQIDELRIYNRRLSDEEVATLASPTVAPGESGYAAWARAFGLTGPAALPDADPDVDGVRNLAEYGFGGHPATPDHERLRAEARVTSGGGQDFLCATYPRAVGAGLTYRVEWSLDLVHWSDAAEVPGFSQEVQVVEAGVPWIQGCFPIDSRSSTFVRVVVEP